MTASLVLRPDAAVGAEDTVAVVVPVGSRHELTEATEGVAHLLEHLLFRGSTSAGLDSPAAVAAAFARIGAAFNAFTSREVTCYYATVPRPIDCGGGDTNRYQRVVEAATILHAITTNPLIMQVSAAIDDEIAREKKVVEAEMGRRDDNATHRGMQLALARVFAGDRTMAHDVAGDTVAAVLRIPPQTIRAFFAEHYRHKHMIIAGSFDDAAELRRQLPMAFVEVDAPPPRRITHRWRVQLRKKPVGVVVERGGQRQDQVCLSYPFDLYDEAGEPLGRRAVVHETLTVLGQVLAGSMSARLWRAVRERHGLAYGISAGPLSFAEGWLFQICTAVHRGAGRKAIEVIQEELAAVHEHGLQEGELQRAIEEIKAARTRSLHSSIDSAFSSIEACVYADAEPVDRRAAICSLARTVSLERLNEIARVLLHPEGGVATVVEGK